MYSCIYQGKQLIIAVFNVTSKRFLMKFVLSIMQSIDYCRVRMVYRLLKISLSKRTIRIPKKFYILVSKFVENTISKRVIYLAKIWGGSPILEPSLEFPCDLNQVNLIAIAPLLDL